MDILCQINHRNEVEINILNTQAIMIMNVLNSCELHILNLNCGDLNAKFDQITLF